MKNIKIISGLLVALIFTTACNQNIETSEVTTPATETPTTETHLLPLGDGNYVTDAPKVGYVYLCNANFRDNSGAFADGPWIQGNSWDPTKKVTVDGSTKWEGAQFEISEENGKRIISANNLPDHITGNYPIASTDDAYSYDRNPNSIKTQTVLLELPMDPEVADQPSCIGGEVGYMTSGVALFDAFDAEGRDAAAHEVQDDCDGHPQVDGIYHYHAGSDCLPEEGLVGYAFDGFGIYGKKENGKVLTTADLDECHGHVSKVWWNGKEQEIYHYNLTEDFPYSVSCFKGKPSTMQAIPNNEQNGPPGGPPNTPPPRP